MKKIAIVGVAIGLAFAGSAFAANVINTDTTQVDVYGSVKGAHKFVSHGKTNGVDATEIQVGINAKQKLNDYFTGIAQYEGQYNTYPQRYGTRQAWAGVDAGDFGAVTIGRQTGAIYTVAQITDMAPGVLSGYTGLADVSLMGRTDGVIQYKNTFGGVVTTGQYKLAKEGKSLEGNTINEGVAYGGSLFVPNLADTGVFGGVAYAHQDLTNASRSNSDVYVVGAGWTDGKYYVAGTSTSGKNIHNVRSLYDNELIAQYNFDNGITPSIGYVDTNDGGVRTQAAETGVTYHFNKNVLAFVDAGWDVTGNNNNQVKTGVKYSF